jgi:hypothetical protein
MIEAQDLEVINKITAELTAHGYTFPKVDASNMNREDVFITICFHKTSVQKSEGEKESC